MTESCLTKSQSIQERKVDLFSSIKFLIEKSAPISGAFVMQSTAERKEELTESEYGTGVQLSWLEHLPCKQGVNGSNPFISTIKWAHSSVGQSTRLISVRSMVRVHLSPPAVQTAGLKCLRPWSHKQIVDLRHLSPPTRLAKVLLKVGLKTERKENRRRRKIED